MILAMASIGESAKRLKTNNMDIFNGLFCAEGSYKQFKSFAMPSNEEDRWGTSDNDTVRVDGQKVGHFLITIQKSFKLIINQLWT